MTRGHGGDGPVPVRNEVSGRAHNVVQAGRIDNVYLSSPGPPVVAGQVVVGPVPREPQHFQRRDQVGELARLAGSGTPAVVCAVTGQRGVGKTQIAGSYARQRIRDGWLTAWIPGETADAVAAGLGELADALGLRREGEDDATVLVRVRNLLQTRRDPALLVFDNVTDPDHVTPYLPATGSTQIVLTSAGHAVERLGTRVPVDLFDQDTATRFLAGSTGLRDEAGARALAAKLGHLPLALAQAAARIARPPRAGDYGTYLRLLEDVSLEQALTARAGDPYPRGAAEAVLLAVEPFLAEEAAAELAVLDLLGVLSPDGVSRALLDVDDDLLNRLFEASLIEFAGGPGDAVVVMHRLTQRVLRERANHDLPSVVGHAARLVDAATFATHEAWQRRDRGDELVRHIDALWEHGSPPVFREVLALRRWAVRQLDHAMAADRAARLAEEVHADHRALRDDDPDRLGARHDLAATYQRVGRFGEAIQHYEQALTAARRIFGDDDPNALVVACNLASAYREAGRLAEAITLLERTLHEARQNLGDDHVTTRSSAGHLAATYQRAGRVTDAIPLFEQVLAGTRRLLGDDDLTTLDAADSLACAHLAAHEPETAIQLLEPALAAGRRRHGDDHPFTLRAASNLAGMYGATGRLAEAIPLYERTLADQRRLFGDHDLDAFFTATNLVDSYRMAGQLDEATRLAEHTLTDRRQVLGDDHPDTLSSAVMLAHVHRDTHRLDEAIRLYEQTLTDRSRVLGADHPDTIDTAASLALAYHDADRADDATAMYERSLADSRRVHGADHEVTRALTAALADVHRSAGRPDQEVPLRQQIFLTARRLVGDTHSDTIGAAGNLAVAYHEGGRPDLAIPYLERAFTESETTHGGADAGTLTLGHNLACAYRDAGRQDEATVLFRRTGIIAMRTLGKDNPLTQAARTHLRPPTDGDSGT